jgi:hypothetical protein
MSYIVKYEELQDQFIGTGMELIYLQVYEVM